MDGPCAAARAGRLHFLGPHRVNTAHSSHCSLHAVMHKHLEALRKQDLATVTPECMHAPVLTFGWGQIPISTDSDSSTGEDTEFHTTSEGVRCASPH